MAVRYEPQGRIALITLDRPDALNTFDRAMHVELHDAWVAFRDDPELYVAVVTGAGDRAFSAGADIRGWGRPGEEPSARTRTVPAATCGRRASTGTSRAAWRCGSRPSAPSTATASAKG